MGRFLRHVAGMLAWLMVAGGIAACCASVIGFFQIMAEVNLGERLYDGMGMVGIFIGVAAGCMWALVGFQAWILRGRTGGYVFLLLGWLLGYYPVALGISGGMADSGVLPRISKKGPIQAV